MLAPECLATGSWVSSCWLLSVQLWAWKAERGTELPLREMRGLPFSFWLVDQILRSLNVIFATLNWMRKCSGNYSAELTVECVCEPSHSPPADGGGRLQSLLWNIYVSQVIALQRMGEAAPVAWPAVGQLGHPTVISWHRGLLMLWHCHSEDLS